ncbi:MAG: hypothetical protein HY695_37975, partial [Deltaproteobacteria bacterium]|nr:hypothetical protein [Deltaproteobacteria bacterium]
LKKRNKQEREGQRDMMHMMVADPEADYNSLAARTRGIDEAPDDTLNDIQRKAEQFGRLVVSPDYQHAQQVADAWCAAFVWEKRVGAAAEPVTTDTIRRLAADPKALSTAQRTEVERLASQYQFFHWHLAFPEVFAEGGFDCMVGNPPWEVLEEEEKKFFALLRPEIAEASTAIRKTLIDSLRNQDINLWTKWQEFINERTRFKVFHRWSGLYPLCSYKKLNTYASFLERAFQLCGKAGRLGLIVQSGLATDESRRFLFEKLSETGCLRSFLDFENSELLFPDVHPQQKFALVTVAGRPSTEPILFSFSNTRLEHLLEGDRQLLFVSEDLKRISPNTGSCPTFQSKRDAVITAKIYRHAPAFQNLSNGRGWKCEVVQMFNISSDNEDMEQLQPPESHGVPTEVVGCRSLQGWLPLYEGKFIGQLDHRYSTFHEQTVDQINHGTERMVSTSEKQDPCLPVIPRWWMPTRLVKSRLAALNYGHDWIAGFCDVANPENQRTAFASIFPRVAAAHTLWMFYQIADVRSTAALVASINSFLFDFVVRRRIGSRHLAKFVFQQLPVIEEGQIEQQISWDADKRIGDWILPRVLELTYTAWDLKPFAIDAGWPGPPFSWGEERRFLLRCELDAAFFHLCLLADPNGDWSRAEGEAAEDLARLKANFPTPRAAVAYIMDTFPIVKRKDEEKWGEYRTKRVILEIFDAVQESIRTGQPYQTRLDPPPADPRCCHPPRVTIIDLPFAVANILPFRRVRPAWGDRYKTCIPLLSVKAAAGGFSEDQDVNAADWVEIKTSLPLRKGMFVAQVVGHSMEPVIPDGAYCVFQFKAPQLKTDMIGLFQLHAAEDPETGGRFTVKRLKMATSRDPEGGLRRVATLVPENPAFKPIPVEGEDVKFVAEFLEVLEEPAGVMADD